MALVGNRGPENIRWHESEDHVREIWQYNQHRQWVLDISYPIVRRFLVNLIPSLWYGLTGDKPKDILGCSMKWMIGPKFNNGDLLGMLRLPWDSLRLTARIEDHKDDRQKVSLYRNQRGSEVLFPRFILPVIQQKRMNMG